MEYMKHYARTYAQSVAGSTLNMKFNWTNGFFSLSFIANVEIKLPSEIFFHKEFYYPNGT
jgi:hypothetical protein